MHDIFPSVTLYKEKRLTGATECSNSTDHMTILSYFSL